MITRKEHIQKLSDINDLIYKAIDRLANMVNHNQKKDMLYYFTEHEIDIADRAVRRLKQYFNYTATSMPLFRTSQPTIEREPFTNA